GPQNTSAAVPTNSAASLRTTRTSAIVSPPPRSLQARGRHLPPIIQGQRDSVRPNRTLLPEPPPPGRQCQKSGGRLDRSARSAVGTWTRTAQSRTWTGRNWPLSVASLRPRSVHDSSSTTCRRSDGGPCGHADRDRRDHKRRVTDPVKVCG